MSEVWAVIDHDYESSEILGVYSSPEKAEAAQRANAKFEHLPIGSERSHAVAWAHAGIYRWEVQ